MPVESGPTMYLPYSHQYEPGYLAWRRPEFRDVLRRAPRAAAAAPRATRRSSTRRCSTGPAPTARPTSAAMANLLQVSSAFGRAMETVDRAADLRRRSTRLLAAGRGRRRRVAGERHRGVRRGLPVPDQPRPRPAGRAAWPRRRQAELVRQALREDWICRGAPRRVRGVRRTSAHRAASGWPGPLAA